MESIGGQILWLQKNMKRLGNLYPQFCARVQQECGCPMRGHKPEAGVTQHNLCPPQSGWVLGGQSRVLVVGSSNSSQHSEGMNQSQAPSRSWRRGCSGGPARVEMGLGWGCLGMGPGAAQSGKLRLAGAPEAQNVTSHRKNILRSSFHNFSSFCHSYSWYRGCCIFCVFTKHDWTLLYEGLPFSYLFLSAHLFLSVNIPAGILTQILYLNTLSLQGVSETLTR